MKDSLHNYSNIRPELEMPLLVIVYTNPSFYRFGNLWSKRLGFSPDLTGVRTQIYFIHHHLAQGSLFLSGNVY